MIKKLLNLLVKGWQIQSQIAETKKKLKELDDERKKIADKEITCTLDITNRKYRLSKNEGKRRRLKLDFANDLLRSQDYDCEN